LKAYFAASEESDFLSKREHIQSAPSRLNLAQSRSTERDN